MIPPSLMNITYFLTAVPIFEREPVEPTASSGESAASCDQPEGAAEPAPRMLGDADGINDQVAMRLVFKGIRWTAVPWWEAEVNPGYERWIEGRSDDDAERGRQDECNRLAAAKARMSPRPAAPGEVPAADAPTATGDGD